MRLESVRALRWATALLVALAGAANAQTAGETAKGKLLFMRCAACHEVSASGLAKIGPTLKGVVGRRAGSVPDYAYSPDMKSKTFSWNDTTLDAWLTKPTALVPGTTMAFGGVADPAERKALIAYLRSVK
jgi:cytochrome c